MAATRAVLLKSGTIADVGTIDWLGLFWAVRGTPTLPVRAPLTVLAAPPKRVVLQPAE